MAVGGISRCASRCLPWGAPLQLHQGGRQAEVAPNPRKRKHFAKGNTLQRSVHGLQTNASGLYVFWVPGTLGTPLPVCPDAVGCLPALGTPVSVLSDGAQAVPPCSAPSGHHRKENRLSFLMEHAQPVLNPQEKERGTSTWWETGSRGCGHTIQANGTTFPVSRDEVWNPTWDEVLGQNGTSKMAPNGLQLPLPCRQAPPPTSNYALRGDSILDTSRTQRVVAAG